MQRRKGVVLATLGNSDGLALVRSGAVSSGSFYIMKVVVQSGTSTMATYQALPGQ